MKKECIEIYFEVLGKEFVLYHPKTAKIPFGYFEAELKKVAPTAHVVNVQTALVSEETAAAFDFKTQVTKWNLELEKRFEDSEATK